jgi:uncharacterized caspase-like protein
MNRNLWRGFVAPVACALLMLAGAIGGARAETRVALVIGNSAYVNAAPLTNPVNDAKDVAGTLESLGFKVILGTDLEKRAMELKIRDFVRALPGADVALFYYAGHGLQYSGQNFLVPVDARLESDRDLDFEATKLEFVLRQMELERESKTNLVFLDACRDNPLARNLARSMGTRSAAVGQGLAQVQTGIGTFITYSTQPGNVALDGSGRNSPFTGALLKHVVAPDRDVRSVMTEVRKDVLAATGGRQVPWDHSSLTGDFYFKVAAAGGMAPKSIPVPQGPDVGALQGRVRQLEEDLKKKSEAGDMTRAITIAQTKERMRQIDEQNRADQQKIFDIQMDTSREGDAQKRANISFEIGKLQTGMVRRNREKQELAKQLEQLEGNKPAEAKAAK